MNTPTKPKPELCKVCKLPNRNYGTRDNGKGVRYYNLTCTTCKARQDAVWRKKSRDKLRKEDPERWYRIRRHDQLRRVFKIGLDDYEAILLKQDGKCAICGNNEGKASMPLDHDHKTGKIRGILCHWCNKGLGQFFDNPERLEQAAKYLRDHDIS
jgi:hypothetical protein